LNPSTSLAPPESTPTRGLELEKPQKLGEGLLRGRALVKVKPVFPPNARSLDLFFRTVVVSVVVSEEGRVVSAKVLRGHPILQEPALDAARKWVFEPATLNGQRVRVESVLTFMFNMDR
jgi:TonB family protein